MNIKEIRLENNGELPAFAWPGGYPLYYVTQDCGILCASKECVNGPEARDIDQECPDDDQWNVVAYDIHYEGEPLICDHCGAEIESAYGVPE